MLFDNELQWQGRIDEIYLLCFEHVGKGDFMFYVYVAR